jgi:hypothetical protein
LGVNVHRRVHARRRARRCLSSPDRGHMCRSIVDTDDGGSAMDLARYMGRRGGAGGAELPGGRAGPRGLRELGGQGPGPLPGWRPRGPGTSITCAAHDRAPHAGRARGRDRLATQGARAAEAEICEQRFLKVAFGRPDAPVVSIGRPNEASAIGFHPPPIPGTSGPSACQSGAEGPMRHDLASLRVGTRAVRRIRPVRGKGEEP